MTEPNPLADEVTRKFLQINRFLRQYARQISEQGIRPVELAILRFLHQTGPATVGQVQGYVFRSPGTTSMVLSQMEEAGYVTRTRSTQDNRVVMVALTETGRLLAETTPLAGIALLRQRLHDLPPERLHRLAAALTEIMTLMEVSETDE